MIVKTRHQASIYSRNRYRTYLPVPTNCTSTVQYCHLYLYVNCSKLCRAALSVPIVEEFFANYTRVAADVPPENVYNYDETNLRDNPGKNYKI